MARPAGAAMVIITDRINVVGGQAYRFSDNGHYVGHDEPSLQFISSEPGSGNNMSYFLSNASLPRSP
jgi:hypothetical protein